MREYTRQEDEPGASVSNAGVKSPEDASKTAAPQCASQPSNSVKTQEAVVEDVAVRIPPEDVSVTIPTNGESDCIICYEGLDTAPVQSLQCGHQFHVACIQEWLEKDGRCPVCRFQEIENPPAPSQAALDVLAEFRDRESSRLRPWQLAALLISSRRLQSLAALEAMSSMIVISTDFVTPLLMLLTAAAIFMGASQYHLRMIALTRPLLALNAILHLYLLVHVVHSQEKSSYDSSYSQMMLLSLAVVTSLELTTLRATAAFMIAIRHFSEFELARIRILRGTQVGWKHRFALLMLVMLVLLPAVTHHLCHSRVHAPAGFCQGPDSPDR